MDQLVALQYEASLSYDICVCVEETQEGYTHVHAAIRYNTPRIITPRTLCHAANVQYDAQAGQSEEDYVAMVNYCKKTGMYYHRREHLPRNLAEEHPVWRRWQYDVLACANDGRQIVMVYDPLGNTGKTYLTLWHCVRHLAVNIAVVRGYQDVMRSVYGRPSDLYFVDLPRAISKKGLQQLVAALETIKNGYSYDDRYQWQERYQEPPKVVVFSNQIIPFDWLSQDRWRVISISQENREKQCAPFAPLQIRDTATIRFVQDTVEALYNKNANRDVGEKKNAKKALQTPDAAYTPEETLDE